MHTDGFSGSPVLTDWRYLIYEIPLVIGGLFMILSAVRPGGHHAAGHVQHGGAGHGHAQGGHGHGHAGNGSSSKSVLSWLSVIFGVRDAPVTMVLTAGLMGWGVFGFCATTAFAQIVGPHASGVIPMAIAAAGGYGSMHVAGRLFSRFLPRDETVVVSRNSLFGLTGTVVYPVSATAGRAHIYDAHGTLHDESCRPAPGASDIAKGAKVMVMDMDSTGRIIVEEIH